MPWTFPSPVPLPPAARVYLQPGAAAPLTEITSYMSQEEAPTLTWTIESPTTTNQFTVADVTLKGYDPSGVVRALLAGIAPSSVDYTVLINLGLAGDDGFGNATYAYDVLLEGMIAPATVQFNPKDFSFTFTVIGSARKLQSTSAANLFKRSSYSDAKWTLQQDASPLDNTLRVTAPTSPINYNIGCDFLAGDVVQVNGAETGTVVSVVADPSTNPPTFWQLILSAPLEKTYAVGAPVILLTPYQRNVGLETAVTTLFAAAGFPAKQYFGAPPLPGITTLFASPIAKTGMPDSAFVQGIAPGNVAQGFQAPIFAGSAFGLYRAPDAFSSFLLTNLDSTGPLIDDTNNQAGYIYQNAPKRSKTRVTGPRFGLNVTLKFYAYDGKFYGGTQNRYCLTVTCNADVDGLVYSFSSTLSWEKQNVLTYAWTPQGTLQSLASSTTTTDLSALYDAIGIEVDPTTGTCFFTDIQNVSGAGTAVTMNVSAWQPTGATIATGTYQANKATGVNGPIVVLSKGSPTYIAVFQVDGVLGKQPQIFVYSVVANGTMTPFSTQACSPYLVGRTVKFNRGDNRWYGLISDQDVGISITSWGTNFTVDATSTPIILQGPPPRPAQSTFLGQTPYEVDLIVLQTSALYGSGQFPFVANFGGSLYYVSRTFTNVIAYLDMTGLSVADALQQLSLLNAGVFYTVPSGWVFRSRSVPSPGYTIGVNDQIDDALMISLNEQSVFNRWIGYVRFENENDKLIYGEAGDVTFADTDQGLTLKSRFITTSLVAKALAQSLYSYLGAQKRWVEIERVRDGRVYEVGRTFRANVAGVNRTFQIIETGHDVVGTAVKVVGLEV